jgi:hypothetical protein
MSMARRIGPRSPIAPMAPSTSTGWFFLHLHAFFFFVAALLVLSDNAAAAWPAWAPVDGAASTVLFWLMVVYSIIAMRRVFRMGWPLTLAKALALFVVYFIVLGLTVAGVFFYAALQL